MSEAFGWSRHGSNCLHGILWLTLRGKYKNQDVVLGILKEPVLKSSWVFVSTVAMASRLNLEAITAKHLGSCLRVFKRGAETLSWITRLSVAQQTLEHFLRLSLLSSFRPFFYIPTTASSPSSCPTSPPCTPLYLPLLCIHWDNLNLMVTDLMSWSYLRWASFGVYSIVNFLA